MGLLRHFFFVDFRGVFERGAKRGNEWMDPFFACGIEPEKQSTPSGKQTSPGVGVS
jgi:hypothetical protein